VVGLLGMTPSDVGWVDSVTVDGDGSLGDCQQGKMCRIGARKADVRQIRTLGRRNTRFDEPTRGYAVT
jgi:hypothetical protein